MLLWLVFLALFLLFVGTTMVSFVYICAIWFITFDQPLVPNSKSIRRGLSPSEIEVIAGVEDGWVVKGTECAVCLDDVEEGQTARVMPECRHAFHRECADAWLSTNAVCPMCRTRLLPPPPPPPDQPQVGGDDSVV